jgi:hypothetical protein
MSELSVLELETEHAELLPERETLFIIGGHVHVSVHQIALAFASHGHDNTAVAVNVAIVGSDAISDTPAP